MLLEEKAPMSNVESVVNEGNPESFLIAESIFFKKFCPYFKGVAADYSSFF